MTFTEKLTPPDLTIALPDIDADERLELSDRHRKKLMEDFLGRDDVARWLHDHPDAPIARSISEYRDGTLSFLDLSDLLLRHHESSDLYDTSGSTLPSLDIFFAERKALHEYQDFLCELSRRCDMICNEKSRQQRIRDITEDFLWRFDRKYPKGTKHLSPNVSAIVLRQEWGMLSSLLNNRMQTIMKDVPAYNPTWGLDTNTRALETLSELWEKTNRYQLEQSIRTTVMEWWRTVAMSSLQRGEQIDIKSVLFPAVHPQKLPEPQHLDIGTTLLIAKHPSLIIDRWQIFYAYRALVKKLQTVIADAIVGLVAQGEFSRRITIILESDNTKIENYLGQARAIRHAKMQVRRVSLETQKQAHLATERSRLEELVRIEKEGTETKLIREKSRIESSAKEEIAELERLKSEKTTARDTVHDHISAFEQPDQPGRLVRKPITKSDQRAFFAWIESHPIDGIASTDIERLRDAYEHPDTISPEEHGEMDALWSRIVTHISESFTDLDEDFRRAVMTWYGQNYNTYASLYPEGEPTKEERWYRFNPILHTWNVLMQEFSRDFLPHEPGTININCCYRIVNNPKTIGIRRSTDSNKDWLAWNTQETLLRANLLSDAQNAARPYQMLAAAMWMRDMFAIARCDADIAQTRTRLEESFRDIDAQIAALRPAPEPTIETESASMDDEESPVFISEPDPTPTASALAPTATARVAVVEWVIVAKELVKPTITRNLPTEVARQWKASGTNHAKKRDRCAHQDRLKQHAKTQQTEFWKGLEDGVLWKKKKRKWNTISDPINVDEMLLGGEDTVSGTSETRINAVEISAPTIEPETPPTPNTEEDLIETAADATLPSADTSTPAESKKPIRKTPPKARSNRESTTLSSLADLAGVKSQIVPPPPPRPSAVPARTFKAPPPPAQTSATPTKLPLPARPLPAPAPKAPPTPPAPPARDIARIIQGVASRPTGSAANNPEATPQQPPEPRIRASSLVPTAPPKPVLKPITHRIPLDGISRFEMSRIVRGMFTLAKSAIAGSPSVKSIVANLDRHKPDTEELNTTIFIALKSHLTLDSEMGRAFRTPELLREFTATLIGQSYSMTRGGDTSGRSLKILSVDTDLLMGALSTLADTYTASELSTIALDRAQPREEKPRIGYLPKSVRTARWTVFQEPNTPNRRPATSTSAHDPFRVIGHSAIKTTRVNSFSFPSAERPTTPPVTLTARPTPVVTQISDAPRQEPPAHETPTVPDVAGSTKTAVDTAIRFNSGQLAAWLEDRSMWNTVPATPTKAIQDTATLITQTLLDPSKAMAVYATIRDSAKSETLQALREIHGLSADQIYLVLAVLAQAGYVELNLMRGIQGVKISSKKTARFAKWKAGSMAPEIEQKIVLVLQS